MVHVWARDILPTSLLNICKTPVKILSWMKDVIPTAFGKVLKEEKKQGTFLKKTPTFFQKSPTFFEKSPTFYAVIQVPFCHLMVLAVDRTTILNLIGSSCGTATMKNCAK